MLQSSAKSDCVRMLELFSPLDCHIFAFCLYIISIYIEKSYIYIDAHIKMLFLHIFTLLSHF